MEPQSEYLRPTWFLDFEAPEVEAFADRYGKAGDEPVRIARDLFYGVRDAIRYDPYAPSGDREAYRASRIAESERNWCVPKSILLASCARLRGIPARLGFADVRNHLTSRKLTEWMGTNIFAWHGYAELWLNERWVPLSTAFNIELCEKFGVKTLEFDAVEGALLHPFDKSGNKHMEYVRQRGSYADFPIDEIQASFREIYRNMNLKSDAPEDEAFKT